MRVPRVLGFSLLLCSAWCGASDQDLRHATASVESRSARSHLELFRSPQDRQISRTFPRKKWDFEPDVSVCYSMRTYVVVRESQHSDVTQRAGYVTCQPAWKFEMRKAVDVR